MSIIYLLIFLSLIVAMAFLVAFIWAQNSGQYDDTESHAVRMLMDKEPKQFGKRNKQ